MVIMSNMWSIGERIFKENYERRMMMFGALVESVALFRRKIYGWREEERLDGLLRRYIKYVLGLDRNTPNYILKEETKMKKMKEGPEEGN